MRKFCEYTFDFKELVDGEAGESIVAMLRFDIREAVWLIVNGGKFV